MGFSKPYWLWATILDELEKEIFEAHGEEETWGGGGGGHKERHLSLDC